MSKMIAASNVIIGDELDKFFQEVELDHQDACLEIAEDGAALARSYINDKTGNLSTHTKAARSKFGPEGGAIVFCNANHAHLVEYGHVLVKGGKKTVQGNVGGKVIGHVPPHPFMRRSRDSIKSQIEESVAMVILNKASGR